MSLQAEELGELVNMKLTRSSNRRRIYRQKRELEDERIRLKELLEDKDSLEPKLEALRGEFFEVCGMATGRFENGSSDERRSIMAQVGSHLLLKDKVLGIHAKKPFQLLSRTLSQESSEGSRLAPVNSSEDKQETESLRLTLSNTRGLVKDVRTYFLEETMNFPAIH